MSQSATARGIRPERERQILQHVTHPANTQRLPALNTGECELVARQDGKPQVRSKKFRDGADDGPALQTIANGGVCSSGNGASRVIFDDKHVGVCLQDPGKVGSTGFRQCCAGGILRASGHDDAADAASDGIGERFGPGSLRIDLNGYWMEPRGTDQVEQRRYRRVLHRNSIARAQMLAEQPFNAVKRARGNRDVVGGDAISGKLACRKRHQSCVQRWLAIKAGRRGDSAERRSKRWKKVGIRIATGEVDQFLWNRALIDWEDWTRWVRPHDRPPAPLPDYDAAGVQSAIRGGDRDRTHPARRRQLADSRQWVTRLQTPTMNRFLDRAREILRRSSDELMFHYNN